MHLLLLSRAYCSGGSRPRHMFLFRSQPKGSHREDIPKCQGDASLLSVHVHYQTSLALRSVRLLQLLSDEYLDFLQVEAYHSQRIFQALTQEVSDRRCMSTHGVENI